MSEENGKEHHQAQQVPELCGAALSDREGMKTMEHGYEVLPEPAEHEHGAPVKMWTKGVPVEISIK